MARSTTTTTTSTTKTPAMGKTAATSSATRKSGEIASASTRAAPGNAPMDTRPSAPLHTPGPVGDNSAAQIAHALNGVLADSFTLYMKTKNFHWHMSGPHFRDYHLLLDEQAEQIFAITDDVAERVRKLGQRTLTSIGSVSHNASLTDNDAAYVPPLEMLNELCEDNRKFRAVLGKAHAIADEHGDAASTSLIEMWMDEAERRTWFLFETARSLGDTNSGPSSLTSH
jgi:starvation-inducible DNA-binding protein